MIIGKESTDEYFVINSEKLLGYCTYLTFCQLKLKSIGSPNVTITVHKL